MFFDIDMLMTEDAANIQTGEKLERGKNNIKWHNKMLDQEFN